MFPTRRRHPFVLFAVFAVLATSPTLDSQSGLLVVASGLDSPRGLNFGPDGALYVVEAGRGGPGPLCFGGRCYGPTGAVTRITGLGVHQRIATGLPSIAPLTGIQAIGPHDIDFGFGSMWVTVGLNNPPADRTPFTAAGVHFGSLVRVGFDGSWQHFVDISRHEATANPDGGALDSNPFGLRLQANRAVLTDAGGNAILQIAPTGIVSTLAVFPNRVVPTGSGSASIQAVPTTVIEGPDGALYVGELTGFPFTQGLARVYRVPSAGGTPVVVATGFTHIIDIVLHPFNGMGYVLEHDADGLFTGSNAGRLVRVNPATGAQTVIPTPGLVEPGGIAVGPDGALYVTNFSSTPGGGQVVRIQP